MNLKSYIKNFGALDFLVITALIYVLTMLVWTASTRSGVEKRAKLIKENHLNVVNFINNQINICTKDLSIKTSWGESCKDNWSPVLIVNNLLKVIKLNNPYSIKVELIQAVNDPRIQAGNPNQKPQPNSTDNPVRDLASLLGI